MTKSITFFRVPFVCAHEKEKQEKKDVSLFFTRAEKKTEISDTQELLEPSNGKVAVH